MSEQRNVRRTMQGTVIATKTKQTATVQVERTYKHARYGKYLRRAKRYLVHDEAGVARPGDVVEVASCRPISKRKRWRIVRVVEHGDLGLVGMSPDAELAEAAAQEGGAS